MGRRGEQGDFLDMDELRYPHIIRDDVVDELFNARATHTVILISRVSAKLFASETVYNR